MPVRNRNGGLHRGTLFDTNIPATTIDKDIFTDQEVEDTIADDDLVLMLDVSEDPDKIKYMTRSDFTAGLSGGTITVTDNESTNETNLITFVADAGSSTGLHAIEMDGDLTYNPSSGTLAATIFSGALSGNATTATALATGRTIAMTGDVSWTSASFDGSGNVTGAGTIQSNAVEGSMLNTNVISGQSEITSGLHAEDELLYSDNGTVKRVGLDNFIELSPALSTEDSVAVASDYILFLDGGASGNMNKESISDLASAMSGTGITAGSGTFTTSAAQTGITSIYATDLIMGEDAQTAIDFGTANEIDFKADNAARLTLTSSALYPVTDNEIDLGTASLEFKDAFFDGTVTSDAFAGPLTGDVTGNADTVTTNANLTGHVTSVGNAAVLGSFTSAQLATALTNETGSGAAVFGTSPTLVTPALGTPASGVMTNVTGTAAGLTAGTATVATTVTITDNESTDEDNAIIFTAGGDVDGGNIGLESDGTLTYNPSDGKVTATGFVGALTGNVTGNTSGTAATVTGGTQASITNVANVVEVGALNAGSITSGFGTIDTGSSTITTTGVITAGGITIGSAAILEAELEIIDGATVTTTELNLLDGDTSVGGSITLADGDGFIVNDGGTMKTIPASDISTYVVSEGSMNSFQLEDDDGTEVTINNANEIKLIGSGITTNWTDTDNGTDGDPYDMTFTVDAAQTGITSIYATDLIMGEDSQTAIDFGTANEIDFKADNAARLTLDATTLYPVTDDQISLGTASLEFKDAFFDGTVTSDAFAGPLTGNVTGTADVATVATTVTITDNESTDEDNAIIFTAGGDVDGGNIGLESDGTLTYNPSTGKITATGFIGALTGNVTGTADTATVATTVTITDNESTDEDNAVIFTAGGDVDGGNLGLESDGHLTYNPSTGRLTATQLAGTLQTAAQTNVTSVGTLDAGAISSGFGNIDVGSSNLTATGSVSLGATSFNDNNITNVGSVALDTITSDGSAVGFGTDGSGEDVYFYSATSGDHMFWDASDEKLVITGTNGQNSLEVADGNVTITDNLTVSGDFTVSGTTTTVDTTNLTVTDPLIKLAQGTTASPAVDLGLIFTRGNGSSTNIANRAILWDESADEFVLANTNDEAGTTTGNVDIDDYANIRVGKITADDTSVFSGSIELGHATDTTIARSGSGDITIEGNAVYRAGGTDVAVADGGTGQSNLNNLITMGTHTTGNYVATVTAGTGLTSTGATSGESIAHGLSVDAAQTGITSIYATDLIIGEDSETAIDFGTANEIDFKINNTTELTLDATALYPTSDAGLDLGTASLEFKDAFFDGTVTSDAFAGPLTGDVTGTADVATVATTVTITDNESTNENNAIIFTAGGDVDGGNIGLESDGDLTYNPSTGLLSSTGVTASGTMTFGSLSDGTITATAFVDEDDMSSNSATLIPTQQSVKSYVDDNAASKGFSTAMAIAL